VGAAAGEEAKGTAKFELYDDAPEVTFASDGDTSAAAACKALWRKDGEQAIARQCRIFVRELQAGADMADELQTTEAPNRTTTNTPAPTPAPAPTPTPAAAAAMAAPTTATTTTTNPSSGAKHTLRITEEFRCSPLDLYKAFLEPERVSGYTMKPAEISAQVGGAFRIRGGAVSGTQVKLVPGERIVQKWRMDSYPEGLYTDVAITIHQREEQVVLELVQRGVPEAQMRDTEHAWRVETFQRMKVVLGYGSARYF